MTLLTGQPIPKCAHEPVCKKLLFPPAECTLKCQFYLNLDRWKQKLETLKSSLKDCVRDDFEYVSATGDFENPQKLDAFIKSCQDAIDQKFSKVLEVLEAQDG